MVSSLTSLIVIDKTGVGERFLSCKELQKFDGIVIGIILIRHGLPARLVIRFHLESSFRERQRPPFNGVRSVSIITADLKRTSVGDLPGVFGSWGIQLDSNF